MFLLIGGSIRNKRQSIRYSIPGRGLLERKWLLLSGRICDQFGLQWVTSRHALLENAGVVFPAITERKSRTRVGVDMVVWLHEE